MKRRLIRAMYACGKWYQDSDCEKAFYWYQKAAESGHGNAQLQLAKIYDEWSGTGLRNVEKNREKALYWYKKAADQGMDGAGVQCDWIMLWQQLDEEEKLSSKAILLCSDIPFHLLMLKQMLQQCGFEKIYETASAEELTRLYRKRQPILVMLALKMNGSLTTDVIESLEKKYPDAKVVLLFPPELESDAENLKKKHRVVVESLTIPFSRRGVSEAIIKIIAPRE